MVTNDERRDVAAKLRFNAGTTPHMNTSDDFTREVFRATMNEAIGDYQDAINRLADLIEPEPERTCRDTDCDTESITCSECGEITRNTLFWVDVDGGNTVKGHRPRFCSNCGAKVVDA